MQSRQLGGNFEGEYKWSKVQRRMNTLTSRKIKELPFDHVYNPSVKEETVVLYADINTELFKTFHSTLKKLADQGMVRYILRYRLVSSTQSPGKPLFVSGYGVELMLKRTDYIVIDDREVEAGTSYPSTAANL
jgi:UDP-glucose:glycoprotein glucosyltransferase